MSFSYTKTDLLYISLSLIKGVGFKLAKKLLNVFGTVENLFDANRKELCTIIGNQHIVDNLISKNCFHSAEDLIKLHSQKNIKILNFWSEFYPSKLSSICDPPLLVFVRGELDAFNYSKSVGIIGTRHPTVYGKDLAKDIVKGVACVNPVIVSGLAFGIDVLAHKNALDYGLKTIAVYAGGVDKVYPAAHSKFAQKILDQGGVLMTEYPTPTQVSPFQFVARNRIIAGLSDVIVVVEAPIKSGSLITASYANDYGKEVFAVPGSLYDKNLEGSHNLIASYQAHIYLSANKFLKFLKWDEKDQTNCSTKQNSKAISLQNNERLIFDIINDNKDKAMHIDHISIASELAIETVTVVLLSLEIEGLITSLPGKLYKIS